MVKAYRSLSKMVLVSMLLCLCLGCFAASMETYSGTQFAVRVPVPRNSRYVNLGVRVRQHRRPYSQNSERVYKEGQVVVQANPNQSAQNKGASRIPAARPRSVLLTRKSSNIQSRPANTVYIISAPKRVLARQRISHRPVSKSAQLHREPKGLTIQRASKPVEPSVKRLFTLVRNITHQPQPKPYHQPRTSMPVQPAATTIPHQPAFQPVSAQGRPETFYVNPTSYLAPSQPSPPPVTYKSASKSIQQQPALRPLPNKASPKSPPFEPTSKPVPNQTASKQTSAQGPVETMSAGSVSNLTPELQSISAQIAPNAFVQEPKLQSMSAQIATSSTGRELASQPLSSQDTLTPTAEHQASQITPSPKTRPSDPVSITAQTVPSPNNRQPAQNPMAAQTAPDSMHLQTESQTMSVQPATQSISSETVSNPVPSQPAPQPMSAQIVNNAEPSQSAPQPMSAQIVNNAEPSQSAPQPMSAQIVNNAEPSQSAPQPMSAQTAPNPTSSQPASQSMSDQTAPNPTLPQPEPQHSQPVPQSMSHKTAPSSIPPQSEPQLMSAVSESNAMARQSPPFSTYSQAALDPMFVEPEPNPLPYSTAYQSVSNSLPLDPSSQFISYIPELIPYQTASSSILFQPESEFMLHQPADHLNSYQSVSNSLLDQPTLQSISYQLDNPMPVQPEPRRISHEREPHQWPVPKSRSKPSAPKPQAKSAMPHINIYVLPQNRKSSQGQVNPTYRRSRNDVKPQSFRDAIINKLILNPPTGNKQEVRGAVVRRNPATARNQRRDRVTNIFVMAPPSQRSPPKQQQQQQEQSKPATKKLSAIEQLMRQEFLSELEMPFGSAGVNSALGTGGQQSDMFSVQMAEALLK